MTDPNTPNPTEHGPAVSVSGSTRDHNGGHHLYHSDPHNPPDQVIDRFIADRHDGAIRVTIETPIENQTETIYGTDGNPHNVPRTITHHLTIHRHGPHAAASYTRADNTAARTWITHNPHPFAAAPVITPAWLDDPPFPPESVITVDELHAALREFLETSQLPTGVNWHEIPATL